MRILHVIDHLGLGGAQTTLADLLAAWPNQDDTLHVLSLGRKTELLPRFQTIEALRLEVLRRQRWDPRSLWDVLHYVRDQQIDVVHAHLAKSICAALWARRHSRSRLIIHAHCDPQREAWLLRRAASMWRSRIDAVIAVSHHTRRELADWYRSDCPPLHMVYNAFGLPVQQTSPRLLVRQQLGIADNVFLLGFVGRLTHQKGLGYLVEALQRIQHRNMANVALVIVGDGPLRQQLQRHVRRCGLSPVIHFVGSQPDAWPWLQEIDAGVLPSLYEGLPTVAVELMACGKPVIATAVNGTPEVIRDGETGILVPPRDSESLARAICQLAADPALCRRLGRRGFQLAQSMFSPGRSSCAVRDVYTTLTPESHAISVT